nr:hypothetical protein [uncultured bacterium]
MKHSGRGVFWLAACAFGLAWACGSGGGEAETPDDAFDRTLSGVQDTKCEFKGRKDRVAVLTVGRGAKAPNVRRVYAVGNERDGRRVLRCREVDTNLDGAKDVVRTYDETGSPELEQSDSDYDGRIDTWVEFRGGEVSRILYDRNEDGKPDDVQVYSGGRLARVQRDATLDGEVDTWEVYEQGRLRRIGKDIDGDHRVDSWYRDESKKSETPVASSAAASSTAAAASASPTSAASGAPNAPKPSPATATSSPSSLPAAASPRASARPNATPPAPAPTAPAAKKAPQ